MKFYKKILVKLAVILPDSIYIKMVYYTKLKRRMNLANPKTYNEKLNWLKLHDRKAQYKIMVDKYDAKEYVARLIGEKYIIPIYGVWNHFNDIDFSVLPEQFVLKTTHDSGGVVIVRNKSEMEKGKVKNTIEGSLNNNYYYLCREWPYKDLKHRIIAEKVISETVPNDYKFFMFNGRMDSVMVCTDRESGHPTFRFYDEKWKRLYYQKKELEPKTDVEKPENYEEMIEIAKKLSEGFLHVRVDLYNVNGKVFFGELTLFDQGGFDTDISYDTDLYWGSKIDLNRV